MRGTELFGVVNAVGKDEAPFGVGVEDFDGLAGHGGLDVAGLLRSAAGHVFSGRNNADHLNVWLQRGESAHDAKHGGDRKSTRLNSSHLVISYAVFCLKKKNRQADSRL